MSGDESFKTRDAASYDDLASSFDRNTDRYSRYAVDAILRHVDPNSPGKIVDIGCGTGVVTLAVAAATRASVIVGLDLSPGMLAVAKANSVQARGGMRVVYAVGDAERLDMPDSSVQQVVSLYAWRHFPDPARATSETFRILRPGGRLVLAVGSAPPTASRDGLAAMLARPGRILARTLGRERAACDHIDQLVERLLPKTEGDEAAGWTLKHHGFSGSLQDLVRNAGFEIDAVEWHGREYVVPSADDFWDLQTTFSSMARKRIATASVADRTRLRAAFNADCDAVLARGGNLVYRVGAVLVSAHKPGDA